MKKAFCTIMPILLSTAYITACGNLDYEPNDLQKVSSLSSALKSEPVKLEHVQNGTCVGFEETTVGADAVFVDCHDAPRFHYDDGFRLVLKDDATLSKCLEGKSHSWVELGLCAADGTDGHEYQKWYFVVVPTTNDTYRIQSAKWWEFIDDDDFGGDDVVDLDLARDNTDCNGCQDFRRIPKKFFDGR